VQVEEIERTLNKCDPTRNYDNNFDLSKEEQQKLNEIIRAREFDNIFGLGSEVNCNNQTGHCSAQNESEYIEWEQKRIKDANKKALVRLQEAKKRMDAFRKR
jgi:hypothetical protein